MKLEKAQIMKKAEIMAIDPICRRADLHKGLFAQRKWIRRLQRREALPRGKPIEAGFSRDKAKV